MSLLLVLHAVYVHCMSFLFFLQLSLPFIVLRYSVRVEYFFHEVSWILIVSPNECRRMIIAVQYRRNSDRLLEMVLWVSGSSWILRKPVDYPNLPYKLHCRCQPHKLHSYHTNLDIYCSIPAHSHHVACIPLDLSAAQVPHLPVHQYSFSQTLIGYNCYITLAKHSPCPDLSFPLIHLLA